MTTQNRSQLFTSLHSDTNYKFNTKTSQIFNSQIMNHEREQERDHVMDLLAQGHSLKEVAEETGLSDEYINQPLNEHVDHGHEKMDRV